MPIRVEDLPPERVLLNCPDGRQADRREALSKWLEFVPRGPHPRAK